jgi:hypothetical protein
VLVPARPGNGSARSARDLDDAADQRKAIGVRTAGREPEQHVALGDPRSVDGQRFFHDTYREPCEIVLAGDEGVGVLRGLAADQRAARELASGGDALDDLGGNRDVESLADVVIEKEQGFRTLDQDVVDAHRDEVDADGVVPVQRERQFQLGADPVRARNQHGFPITPRQLDQRAESADAGQHLGAHRPLREWLDPLDQRIAGVDVDTGLAIRQRRRRGGNSGCHRRREEADDPGVGPRGGQD